MVIPRSYLEVIKLAELAITSFATSAIIAVNLATLIIRAGIPYGCCALNLLRPFLPTRTMAFLSSFEVAEGIVGSEQLTRAAV